MTDRTASTTADAAPVLVTGGTGKTGRRVAERLRARGVAVRTAARSGADVALDWDDGSTYAPALAGTRAVYVAFAPDLAVPGAPARIAAFTAAAVGAGVERLVLLSGRGEDEAQRCEELVLRTPGIDATVVRASWFAQNFDEGHFADGVREGAVVLPVDAVREPFVDADDLADVAVAALLEDGHAGEVYEATGPRLLTFGEAVAEIAAATGREIAFVPITVDEYAAGAAAAGVPEGEIALLRYLFTEVLDGRNASVADGVERALGRPPRDFAAYARAAAATGVWTAPAPAV